MTKLNFEIGDKIGRFSLTEFGGTDGKGSPYWWALNENGKEVAISEAKLRKELRLSELTPEYIRKLSAKAYDELRKEVGETEINRVMGEAPVKAKSSVPTAAKQHEISKKWFEWHPQIPQTRNNALLFDTFLAELKNPTFTSNDFDLAFETLFRKLELNPVKAGITGFGEAITGEVAIQKFTAAQLQQVQKAFPVKAAADFNKLSENEILLEVAKTTDAEGFRQFTEQVDKEKGLETPVPPILVADREKTWSNFFQIHSDISPTDRLKAKLLEVLAKNGLSVQSQHLDMALDALIEAVDPSVTKQDSATYRFGRAQLVLNEPRSPMPTPAFDPTAAVTVTLEEINKMDAKTYAEKLCNPAFKAAVDALLAKISEA